ncbi:hypothetical protein INR49_031276 [Caranx melampygus]|nr:hypothetical protein INR49_031276 [Caranx melampygus]
MTKHQTNSIKERVSAAHPQEHQETIGNLVGPDVLVVLPLAAYKISKAHCAECHKAEIEGLQNMQVEIMKKPPFHAYYNSTGDLLDAAQPGLPPEKLQEMLDWLKVNKFPVSEVEAYMKETATYRGKWIPSNGSKSIPEMLKEFPRLVDSPGMWCYFLRKLSLNKYRQRRAEYTQTDNS